MSFYTKYPAVNEALKEVAKLPNSNIADFLEAHIRQLESQIREMDNWFYEHY